MRITLEQALLQVIKNWKAQGLYLQSEFQMTYALVL